MGKIKPILFSTEMVRAILESRKTVTRRVVKLKYSNTHLEMRTDKYGTRLIELQNEEPGVTTVRNPDGTTTHKLLAAIERTPPCRPGDILYVRETWAKMECSECSEDADDCESAVERDGLTIFCNGDMYVYKATDILPGGYKWRPSIHMPREAARIFLRVTDVRVERLKDIGDCTKEGITPGKHATAHMNDYDERCDFAFLWNSTIKKADRALYGWDANPWCWVIEFERVSKEDVKHDT